MAISTCCIPATAGVTAGAVVVSALGYIGDRYKSKGKTEDFRQQQKLQKARTSMDHLASQKAHADLTGSPGKQLAQPMPVEIQARMDNIHRILEAAVEEKKAGNLAAVTAGPCSQAGTLRPAFEGVSKTSGLQQAGGDVSAKTLERKASGQTEEGLQELLAELESAEGKYQQAERRVLQLEERLRQLEVVASPRPLEADNGLNQLQAPELQQRVLALTKALEDKEKALGAAKAALEEQEGYAEESRQRAQVLEGQGADLEQYQELTRQMKKTAELREVEVNMLGHQLGEAQAEADALRSQMQQTEAVLDELHARLKEQEEVLASNSPGRWEDMRERCQEAEGQYQQLQRQLHEEREQVELHKQEKEQHLQALNDSASEHKLLSQRVDHLESAVDQKDLQIRKLQEAVRAQEAEAAGQAGGTDHEILMEQAAAAHAQVTNLEASLVQLKQQAEADKAAMQAQLNMEMERAATIEKAMREAEAESHEARRAAAAAQHAAAVAEQEAAQLREAARQAAALREETGTPNSEAKSLSPKRFGMEDKLGSPSTPNQVKLGGARSPSKGSPSPRSQSSSTPLLPHQDPHGKSKLTTHELQALQVRLNAAESRLKGEEAKNKDMEREVELLRKEVSMAKSPVQSKAEQAAMVEQLMAQMEAERGAAREHLETQRHAFERQLEEAAAAARSTVDTSALDAMESENKLLRGEVAALKAELARAVEPPSMPGSKGNSAVVLARAVGGSQESLTQTAPAQVPSPTAVAVSAAGAVHPFSPGHRVALAPPSPLFRAAPPSPGSSANTRMGASPQLASQQVLMAPAKAAAPLAASPGTVGATPQRPRRMSTASGLQSARGGRVPVAAQADLGRRVAPREPLVSAAAAAIGASQALSASMPGAVMGGARRLAAAPPGALAAGRGPFRS